jgi:asparagine synthase (glutamine-hydrolysing)
LFWQLVESWRAENPPQQGPNWKCGQETAIRLTAWCFGLYGFMDSPSTTPQRVALLAQMIAVGAERIAANIGYAISQMNNHPMSEAAGLWTAGLLFPEFKNAPRWKARGRAILTTLARRLIYDDGAFSQHSMNYHRVMLHVYLWAIRLGELNDAPLDPETTGRIGRAADLLFQLQDESSGRVPHCGADDGALILPLSDCEYHDFRPVVQATRRCVYGCNTYGPGPWDEDLLWLFGPARDDVPVRAPVRRDWAAEEGGYHTLRAADGFAFLRCGAFRHRPSQADMLHVDLWWRGQNMAIDAGTFSYNAPAPWDGAFSRTAVHNTVSVDGADQMPRVSRFLMLPWLTAKVTARATGPAGHLAWLECRHDGYQRLDPPVTHARAICRIGDAHWLVVDRLSSRREHDYRLHWLLRDVPYRWDADARLVALETPAGVYSLRYGILDGSSAVSLVRAQPDGTRGWYAPFYASKQPALSLELTSRSNVARMWTLLGPGRCDMVADAEGWTLTEDRWRATVVLHEGPDGPIFRSAAWTSADGATDRIADTSGGVRPGDSPAGAHRPPDSR